MDEEPEENAAPDWPEIMKSQMNMAELLFCYHQALIGAGFKEMAAMQLTASYQWCMMAMGAQG